MIARLIITAMVALSLSGHAHAGTLEIAKRYIGLSETKHRKQLKALIGVDPRRTPWCGAYLTAVIRKAGKRPPRGSFMAASWLGYGKAVRLSQARPGDIVVVRSVRNHVGIFHHRQAGKVCLVSGNSRNAVRIGCYPASRVKGVRR